jgi:fermentation-respiration switch protein FrsA (DUF1100 family)
MVKTPPRFRSPRYWLKLFLFTLFTIYILWSVGLATFGAITSVHPAQRSLGETTPTDWGLTYEPVTFSGFDGARLAGWYIPPQPGSPGVLQAPPGAAVILLHGYSGTRLSNIVYAKMLARHGFALLTFDQRATGESEGKTLTWGWLDAKDLGGAVDFLLTQKEIDPLRIGVLGCSTGAEVAITGSALDERIAAIAADAPFYATASDIAPATWEEWLGMPMYHLFIQLVKWRSGASPEISVSQAVAQLSPRPLLLISSGQAFEYHQSVHFLALAGEPKEHWNIPEAQHCGGPRARPEEYEVRLSEFFAQALER